MRIRSIPYFFSAWVIITGCHDDNPDPGFHPFIWDTSTPEEQGINSQILDSAFITADNLGYMDGLLVIRNGYLVAEK